MADDPQVIEFDPADLTDVIAAVDRVRSTRSGWVNLGPTVPEDQRQRPASILGRVFSSRGPDAPLATITPGRERRDGATGPTSIGLVHPLRERLRPWLFEHELAPPASWRLKQDNPMRGAVWEVPADASTAPLVTHLIAMATALDRTAADPNEPDDPTADATTDPAAHTWMAELHP